jgi:quercetin dioxygenase-like cupin family protein
MATKLGRKWWVVAPVAALIGVSVCSVPVQATPSTSTTTTPAKTLAKSVVQPMLVFGHGRTLAGGPWAALLSTYGVSDGYIVDNLFKPGEHTDWHSHPGPSLIFVTAGTITNYDSDAPHCQGKDYSTGTSFIDAGGTDVHMLQNNGTTDAETIAVQLIPSGQPRKVGNLEEPANCHVP